MNILIYLAIFVFKIIEDALATLRLIVVSNGKKNLGAVLQFIVTLIWIVLTGTVLIGLRKDIFKAIAFAFGALVGSFLGSVLEEKIALGTNVFIVEADDEKVNKLVEKLYLARFDVFKVKGEVNKTILFIVGARKESKKIVSIIKSFNEQAFILAFKVKNSF